MKEKQAMKSTRGLTLVALVIGILASIPSPGWSQTKTGLESLYLPTYDLPDGGLGSCQYLRPFQGNGIFGIWIDYIPSIDKEIACEFNQPKGYHWYCAYKTEPDAKASGYAPGGEEPYNSKGVIPRNKNHLVLSDPINRIITGFGKGGSNKVPSFITSPKVWVIKKDGTLDYDRISTNQWDFGTTCRGNSEIGATEKKPHEIPAWSGSYYAIVNAGYPIRIELSGVKGDSYVVSGFHEKLTDGTAYDIQFKSIPKVWRTPIYAPEGGGATQDCEGQININHDFTRARSCMQGLTFAQQIKAPDSLGVDFKNVPKGPLVATPLYPNYPSKDSQRLKQETEKVEPLTKDKINVSIKGSTINKGCDHPVAATKKETTLTVSTTNTYPDGTQVEFECRLDGDEHVKTVTVAGKKASATFTFNNTGVYRCTATAVGEFHFGVAGAQQVGSMRMFDARTHKPLRMYWDDELVKDEGESTLPDGKKPPLKVEVGKGGVVGEATAAPVCSGTDINARCWGDYSKNYGENSIGRTTVMDTWVFYPQSDAFEFTVTASEDPKTADTDGDNTKDFDEGCNGGGNQNPNHNPQDDSNDDDKDGINNKEEGKPDNRDTDGDGKPDYNDDDSDNDGLSDKYECRRNEKSRPGQPGKYYRSVVPGEVNTKDEGCLDSDGDGYPDYIDLDSDNDGIPDAIECTNPGACEDTDGDGIPDYLDLDSDNDGIPDNVEAFISNGKIDASRLIDPNDYDQVQNPTAKKVAGLGPRVGIPKEVEHLPLITDISQLADSDGDGIPDFRDTDSDNDGVGDLTESKVNRISSGEGATTPGNWQGPKELGLPATAVKKASSEGSQNKDVEVLNFKAGDPVDANKNGIADKYENPAYNKPNNNSNNSNPKNIIQHRLDADKDGILDHVDPDLDNDGIPDIVERDVAKRLPGPRIKDPVTGEMVLDSDGDGIPNYLDVDSDNDGIPDAVECTYSPSHTQDTVDNQSGYVLGCQDSDQGIKTPNALGEGGKGDGLPDYLDKDSDDDGILDNVEALRFNPVHGTFHDPTQVIDPKKTGKDVPIKEGSAKKPSDLIRKTLDDLKGNGAPIGSTGNVIALRPLDDYSVPDPFIKVADSDGDGIPDYRDFDSDNDGIPDAYEAYKKGLDANNPEKGIEPSGKDENHNGVDDAFDPACETDDKCKASWSDKLPMAKPEGGLTKTQAPAVTDPGKSKLPNYINPDVPTSNGQKPLSPADDVNHNGVIDKNDPALCTQIPCSKEDLDNLDSDGDGIPDSVEKVKKGEGLAKLYGKDVPTACSPPFVKGVDKCDEYLDTDGDGIPNFLDKDSDNDGIPDSEECKYNKEKDINPFSVPATPTEYVGGCINTDWNANPGTPDHFPDYLDNDSDGDGVTDNNEAFDYDNDGLADPGFVVPPGTKDVDGNGVPNAVKPGLATKTKKGGKLELKDADGDGIPNHIDFDSNGDGKPDADQAYDPKIEPLHKDANNNGVDDAFDFACNGTNGCKAPTATNGQKIKESPVTTFGPDGTPRKDPNTVAKAFEPHKSSNGKTATYVDVCAGQGAQCNQQGGKENVPPKNPDEDLDAVGFVAGGCSSTPSEAPQSLWLLLVGAGLAFFRRRKKK